MRTECIRTIAALVAVGVVVLAGLPGVVMAGEADTAILDERIAWRCHFTWKTEQVRRESGDLEYAAHSVRRGKGTWRQVEPWTSMPPPADWARPEFDDASWTRARGPFGRLRTSGNTSWPRTLALLCLRGKFEVTDQAKVGDLTLDLAFRGGAVVYLNGAEVARGYLPEGRVNLDTPAEDYPTETYTRPDGTLLRRSFDAGLIGRFRKRIRRLSGVRLPASLLRKGRNVLAVEVHRAPTAEILFTGASKGGSRAYAAWSMLSLESLRLTAAAGAPLVPVTGRPRGLQVWNANTMHKVRPTDRAIPGEPLRPISLVGARNGAFSGQVVVGSTEPIRGLKAAATDLKGKTGGTIPASAVEVRYAKLDGPGRPAYFDGLEDAAPADVPVNKESDRAVQPVWITVHVPRGAKPGDYEGAVTLSAAGTDQIAVRVRITVADWALPDSKQFASFLGLVQSPETLAKRYNVPMWSEEHWRLIDRSFELMGQLGNKAVYLPLLRRTHFGNEHSMVRWMRQPGGGWTHDFSIAERYLDTAIKHLGTVPVVCLYAWTSSTGSVYMSGRHSKVENAGMPITVVNPASGALEEAVGPKWGEPAVRTFWKPVFDGLREILKKRGLAGSIMVGICTDQRPRQDAVDDLKAAAPDARWVVACHPFTTNVRGVPVGYLAHVWGISTTPDPTVERVRGWQNPTIHAAFPRYGCPIVGHSFRTWSALPAYRLVMEAAVTSPGKRHIKRAGKHYGLGLRGVGRLGADFWHVVPTRHGRKIPLHKVYPQGGQDHAVNLEFSAYYVLSPGSDGAIATARFENMREGIQETEARIFIEKALSDPARKARLGADLAERCQRVLDERTVALIRARDGANAGRDDPGWLWFIGSGWQQRSAALYAAAAEVTAQIHEAAETARKTLQKRG